MKCNKCLNTSELLGHKTLKSYYPFGWGPSTEEPLHFYVFPENIPEPEYNQPQELPVIKLCEVREPIKRC